MSHPLIRTTLLGGLALTSLATLATDNHGTKAAAAAPKTTVTATAVGTAPTPPAAGAQTLGPAAEGRRLYLKLNCYSCHGMSGGGGMGPRIVGAEYGDVSEAVLKGEGGGMRSYSGYVTTTDITNLSAYLRSIGTSSEPTFRDWWVTVPSK